MDEELEKFFKDTFFLVEADSFSQLKLWEEYPKLQKFWQQQVGMSIVIGRLDDMPVKLCCMPVLILGKKVIFWELVSAVQDYRMVEPFFDKICNPKWDNGTRRARTDAMNFHNVISELRETSNDEDWEKLCFG